MGITPLLSQNKQYLSWMTEQTLNRKKTDTNFIVHKGNGGFLLNIISCCFKG